MANIVLILLGILQLLAGIFLLAEFLVDTGTITSLAMLIILVLWIVIIVLVDIIGKGGLLNGAFRNKSSVLSYLKSLSAHLLVLGAILSARES